MAAKSTGRVLGAADHRMLLIPSEERLLAYRELVQNGMENQVKGFSNSRIKIQRSGNGIQITDQSCGMSADELRKYIGDFFSGAKKRSRSDNFGLGAKSILSIAKQATWTSWQNNGLAANQITLRLRDDSGFNQVVEVVPHGPKGEELKEVARKTYDKFSPHGTIVECQGMDDDPSLILSYLNQRYLTTACPIDVEFPRRSGGSTHKTVKGALDCLRLYCDEHCFQSGGAADYPHCKLYWGILPTQMTDTQRAILEEWVPVPFTLAKEDDKGSEAIQWWTANRGGFAKLKACGITHARDRVIAIVVAKPDKGKRLEFDLFRGGILNWNEAEALGEIADDLPTAIRELIDGYEATHTIMCREDVLQYWQSVFQVGGVPGKRNPSPSEPNPKKKVPHDPSVNDEETKRTSRGKGYLEVEFLDSGMGTTPLELVPTRRGTMCQVNLTYPPIQRILEAVPKGQHVKLETAIAFQLQVSFAGHVASHGEEPSEEVMTLALDGPILAMALKQDMIKWPTDAQLRRHQKASRK